MISAWELRNKLRESAAKRISVLEAIIDDENANPKVRVVALAVMLSHGFGIPQVAEETAPPVKFGAEMKQ